MSTTTKTTKPKTPKTPKTTKAAEPKKSSSVELSIRIMGVHDRDEHIKYEQSVLPTAKVVYDKNYSVLDTAKRAWTSPAQSSTATHRLVIQDDIELCDGFENIVNRIITAHPKAVITLLSWNFQIRNRLVEGKDTPYWEAKNLAGGAIVMPIEYVKKCWDWIDENLGGKYGDDYSIYLWAQNEGIECIQLNPSIVQHVSKVSIINPRAEGRNWRTYYYEKEPKANWESQVVLPFPWKL